MNDDQNLPTNTNSDDLQQQALQDFQANNPDSTIASEEADLDQAGLDKLAEATKQQADATPEAEQSQDSEVPPAPELGI